MQFQLVTRNRTHLSGKPEDAGKVAAVIESEHDATEIVNLLKVGQLRVIQPEQTGSPAPSAKPNFDDPETSLSAQQFGLSTDVVNLLAKHDPPILSVEDARRFLAEHGDFVAVSGIGKVTSKVIEKSIA